MYCHLILIVDVDTAHLPKDDAIIYVSYTFYIFQANLKSFILFYIFKYNSNLNNLYNQFLTELKKIFEVSFVAAKLNIVKKNVKKIIEENIYKVNFK